MIYYIIIFMKHKVSILKLFSSLKINNINKYKMFILLIVIFISEILILKDYFIY